MVIFDKRELVEYVPKKRSGWPGSRRSARRRKPRTNGLDAAAVPNRYQGVLGGGGLARGGRERLEGSWIGVPPL